MRSPLAENIFRQEIAVRELDGLYYADSAGTSAWHIGESPDDRMRRVAASYGLKYDGRARQFQTSDFDKFDLIIAMDRENYKDLLRLAKENSIVKGV